MNIFILAVLSNPCKNGEPLLGEDKEPVICGGEQVCFTLFLVDSIGPCTMQCSIIDRSVCEDAVITFFNVFAFEGCKPGYFCHVGASPDTTYCCPGSE